MDVTKMNVAWARLIASYDPWRQDTALRTHPRERDILQRHQWLRPASTERIEHAAWASAVWLLLLLWTDVYSIPDWLVDADVVVEDVGDFAGALVAGVSLDVNRFDWIVEFDVPELDPSDTMMILIRRHRADAHANAKHDGRIFNEDVLGAAVSGDLIRLIARLNRNSIVPVGNL